MASRAPKPQREGLSGRLVVVAVRYAEHGWPVVPLHAPQAGGCTCRVGECASPGKHPRTRQGLHDATTDVDRVRGWWARWPEANIGITTGAASGLLVLDIDLPDGPASLSELQAEHGRLPPTCEQRTGSGGRQLLLVHPGGTVGNRSALLPGVDVRGDGGYIVAPPSLHASGERYRWTVRTPPAAVPRWLLAVLERARPACATALQVPSRPLTVGTPEERYAAAALGRELAALSSAVEGTRNDALNRAAFNLGQLVGGGLLDRQRVVAQLEGVATAIGLGEREVRRTIASGLTAGAEQPRTPSAARVSTSPRDVLASPAPVRRLGPRHR